MPELHHAHDGLDPAFPHLGQLTPLHDWQDRAPLSWSVPQALGVGVAWCLARRFRGASVVVEIVAAHFQWDPADAEEADLQEGRGPTSRR